MSSEIDELMSRSTELFDQLFLQTKSTVIGSNSNTHMLPFISVRPCRCLIGQHHCLIPMNLAARNRSIGFAEARERGHLIVPRYQPQNATGTIEDRIRQRHPTPPLIDASQRDI